MNATAAIALFGFTLRRLAAGKRIVAALAISAVAPACEALLCAVPNRVDATHFYDIAWEMGCHLEPLLLALVYALALTTSEIEDGTAPYVLLAALPRGTVALVQVLATAFGTGAMLTLSMGATYLVDVIVFPSHYIGVALPFPAAVAACAGIATAAVLAYLAVFTFTGIAFRRGIAASIGIAIIWEAIVAQMPLRASWYTVTNNVRALLDQVICENYGGAIGYAMPTLEERPTAAGAAIFLAVVTGIGLALAMLAASRRPLARGETG
jgi:hypothetical protein